MLIVDERILVGTVLVAVLHLNELVFSRFPQLLVIVCNLIAQLSILSPQVVDLTIQSIYLSFAVFLLLCELIFDSCQLFPQGLYLIFVALAGVVGQRDVLLPLLDDPLLGLDLGHLFFLLLSKLLCLPFSLHLDLPLVNS